MGTAPSLAPRTVTETEYGASFYEREGHSSRESAEVLVPILVDLLAPKSVVDIGCGAGSFPVRFLREGLVDVVGVEGEWVRTAPVSLPRERYRFADLAEGFDLGRRFDLVVCLEVAEHIDAARADTVVATLARHGDVIAFSAAVPSQGGTHHVNLQWPEYWARRFRARGFVPFDPVRPKVLEDPRVAVYYAQNLIVYARPATPIYERLRQRAPPVRGRVPFRIREGAHPMAGRILNRMPLRWREWIYASYRERFKRWMPGRYRDMA